jgi:4-hydroxy-tetrahydrodipicolinate synthase
MPNIAGLKQAVGGVDADTLELMANKPSDFDVLCGDDAFLFSLLCLGAAGAIAASAHFCTGQFVAMVEAVRSGDNETARNLAAMLLPVCQALFEEPSPSVLKGVMAELGRISTPALRAPMTPASDQAVARALRAIEKVA